MISGFSLSTFPCVVKYHSQVFLNDSYFCQVVFVLWSTSVISAAGRFLIGRNFVNIVVRKLNIAVLCRHFRLIRKNGANCANRRQSVNGSCYIYAQRFLYLHCPISIFLPLGRLPGLLVIRSNRKRLFNRKKRLHPHLLPKFLLLC